MEQFENQNLPSSHEPKPSFIRALNPFAYTIIVLMIIFFLYQMIGGAMAFLGGATDLDKNVSMMRIILSFSQFMLILAPTLFFTRLQTDEVKKHLRLRMPKFPILLLSILGIILLQPPLQSYLHLQEKILDSIPFIQDTLKQMKDFFDLLETSTMKIVKAYSVTEFLVVVFVIGLTPSICEEFLFRGFVLKNFEKVTKPSTAIFFSAFIFGMYHFQPFNIVPLVALGGYLGFVVYCSNSVLTGVACHFVNNFLAAFYVYKFGKDEIDTPKISSSQETDLLITLAVSLILFGSIVFLIDKFKTKEKVIE